MIQIRNIKSIKFFLMQIQIFWAFKKPRCMTCWIQSLAKFFVIKSLVILSRQIQILQEDLFVVGTVLFLLNPLDMSPQVYDY